MRCTSKSRPSDQMVIDFYTVYNAGKRCGMPVMYLQGKHRSRKDNIWHISIFINVLADILKYILIKKYMTGNTSLAKKEKNEYYIIFQG